MPQPTEQQIAVAEALALAEYRQHAGKLIEVDYICGYDRNGDGSDDWECKPPIIVKVTPNQNPHQGILHWNDEWLDPYWDVEVVCGPLSELGIRSTWIDGPSHNAITGERQWSGVRPLGLGESLTARLKGLLQ